MTRSPLHIFLANQLDRAERTTPSLVGTRALSCFSQPPTYLGVVMTYRRSAATPTYPTFERFG